MSYLEVTGSKIIYHPFTGLGHRDLIIIVLVLLGIMLIKIYNIQLHDYIIMVMCFYCDAAGGRKRINC